MVDTLRNGPHPLTEGGLFLFQVGKQRQNEHPEQEHQLQRLEYLHGITSLPGD
jgi:hypothetical protein